MKKALYPCIILIWGLSSCSKDDEIINLLNSPNTTEIIEGSYKAGESGDKKYIPLLLKDAGNSTASTALHWKGYTVYTEKMYALERILHVKPPHPYKGILQIADSVNINFYNNVWNKMHK